MEQARPLSRRIRARARRRTSRQQRPELPTPQSPEQNRPNQDPNAPTQNAAAGLRTGPDEPTNSRLTGRRKVQLSKPAEAISEFVRALSRHGNSGIQHSNKPRVEQLIHDGKLEITLQDAVELALENNMDIAVARYQPWLADTDILATKGGGSGAGH